MTPVWISLSMAFEKSVALNVLHNELVPVAGHLTKMWIHAPSKWDVKWEGDIASFFPKILLYANNVKTKKGKLPALQVEERLADAFVLCVVDIPKFYRDGAYQKLKKAGPSKALLQKGRDMLLPALLGLVPSITSLILSDVEDAETHISKILCETLITVRNHNDEH